MDFFYVPLGNWTWRKICHKWCRGRAFLFYGCGGVALDLMTQKMTSDIFCSQKASLPYECGCELLVYWSKERSYHTLDRGGPWSSAGWELLHWSLSTKITKFDTINKKRVSLDEMI